jgi:DNA polymerase-3 subunit delta
MILFLYGQDTYRSRKKLDEIKAKFLRDVDPSGLNLTVLDGAKAEISEMRAAASSSPFLAKKRLVILKNAISESKKAEDETLAELLEHVPEETILTIFEEAGADDLDGKISFERLKKEKFYPEFTRMNPTQLASWIAQEAKLRGVDFEKEAHRLYASVCGNDLWKVASELDQLSAFAKSRMTAIDAEGVRSLANVRVEENIFDFLDAIGSRRLDRAAQLLERLLDQGESEVALLSRVQTHVRSLLICADLSERGHVSKEVLARSLGLHPFVAGKVLSQARYHKRDELVQLYDWLIEADRRLKTGGWTKPRMAVDLFLMKLSGDQAQA